MERILPAQTGSSAAHILDFIKDTEKICLHSFVMLRSGRIFAEKAYHGIKPSDAQRLYSVSKSFTGAAIGMLEYEGRLKLDDRVTDLWGTESPHKWVNDMTLRDCLRMATCHDGTTYKVWDSDWVKTFLEKKPSHPPGTVFHYDTSAAHFMSALVEKLTGMRMMEYLRERMGLSDEADCVKAPDGYSWGGSGVIANLYDMAKLGMLYMNGGVLNGKRLLSEDFAKAAVSEQIENDSGFNHRWVSGYGYQNWITDYGYVFYGMGSQDVFCIPDKDFIFVCTADTMGEPLHGRILEEALLHDIVDRLDSSPEENPEAERRLAEIELDFPKHKGVGNHVSGRGVYELKDNPMGILRLETDYDNGELRYDTTRGRKVLHFGKECYEDSIFPETHYFGRQIGISAERGYRCCAAGAWVEENKLRIKVWLLDDHTGGVNITLVFKGDEIAVCMRKHGEWYLDEYLGFAGGQKIPD